MHISILEILNKCQDFLFFFSPKINDCRQHCSGCRWYQWYQLYTSDKRSSDSNKLSWRRRWLTGCRGSKTKSLSVYEIHLIEIERKQVTGCIYTEGKKYAPVPTSLNDRYDYILIFVSHDTPNSSYIMRNIIILFSV